MGHVFMIRSVFLLAALEEAPCLTCQPGHEMDTGLLTCGNLLVLQVYELLKTEDKYIWRFLTPKLQNFNNDELSLITAWGAAFDASPSSSPDSTTIIPNACTSVATPMSCPAGSFH